MKIIFLIPSSVRGGHEFQSAEMINEAISLKHEITIISNERNFINLIRAPDKVHYIYQELPEGSLLRLFLRFHSVISLLNKLYDNQQKIVICGGTIEPVIYYSMIFKNINPEIRVLGYVPMFVDKRIIRKLAGCVHNALLRFLSKKIEIIITINRTQAKLLNGFYNVKTIVFPNKFNRPSTSKKSFGKRVVYCGRLDDNQKRVMQLLDMLDSPKNPYRHGIVIGDGPIKNKVADFVRQTRHINLEYLGWKNTEEIDDLIGTEDVLIMNSQWEGDPLVIREFASRGVPTIAKSITGIRTSVPIQHRFHSQDELYLLLNKSFNERLSIPSLPSDCFLSRVRKSVIEKVLLD